MVIFFCNIPLISEIHGLHKQAYRPNNKLCVIDISTTRATKDWDPNPLRCLLSSAGALAIWFVGLHEIRTLGFEIRTSNFEIRTSVSGFNIQFSSFDRTAGYHQRRGYHSEVWRLESIFSFRIFFTLYNPNPILSLASGNSATTFFLLQ